MRGRDRDTPLLQVKPKIRVRGHGWRQAVDRETDDDTNTKRVTRTGIATIQSSRYINDLVEIVDCCSSHYS